jgi:hypothetical protein
VSTIIIYIDVLEQTGMYFDSSESKGENYFELPVLEIFIT